MNSPLDSTIATAAAGLTSPAQQTPQSVLKLDEISSDGRVLKNGHKIELINSSIDSRVTASFYSWQISREMRRDFNLLSNKLFMRVRRDSNKKIVREMMMEMREQGLLLQAASEAIPLTQLASPSQISLRIVCPLAATLYKVMSEPDLAIAVIHEASKNNTLSQNEAQSMIDPFFMAYRDLKRYLLSDSSASTMTAAQLGTEKGIT